jgi:hypothetical protein
MLASWVSVHSEEIADDLQAALEQFAALPKTCGR